jgi:hypothetical protein
VLLLPALDSVLDPSMQHGFSEAQNRVCQLANTVVVHDIEPSICFTNKSCISGVVAGTILLLLTELVQHTVAAHSIECHVFSVLYHLGSRLTNCCTTWGQG